MLNLSLILCFFADISIDVMGLRTLMAGCLGSLDKLRPTDSQLLDEELVHNGILSWSSEHPLLFRTPITFFSAQTWPVVLEPWFKLHDGALGTSWDLNMSEAFIQQCSLCHGCELNILCCMKPKESTGLE